ncbi:MAG: uridine kinase [Aristaeellaceae bacterium]
MELLTSQYQKYPQMQCRDCLKALFQAEWGCEHLISDEQGVYSYLKNEWEQTPATLNGSLVEPLGDNFARLHIAAAKAQGLSMDTLFRMFLHASKVRCGNQEHFSDALDCIVTMAQDGGMPFSAAEADDLLRKYREQGCPPIHHSESFRQHYHPAYRVIDRETASMLPILLRIDHLMREKEHVIVAIDGHCASGKSTLASLLAEIYRAPVVHMDDFFLQPHQRSPQRFAQPGGNVDAERFLAEVLTPLRNAQAFAYRPYSCRYQKLMEPVPMDTYPLAIVEGSYSLHPMLESHYDLRLLMTIDPQLQKERLLHRDGEAMLTRFESEWIPLEEHYFAATHIRSRCDFIISTDCCQQTTLMASSDAPSYRA